MLYHSYNEHAFKNAQGSVPKKCWYKHFQVHSYANFIS